MFRPGRPGTREGRGWLHLWSREKLAATHRGERNQFLTAGASLAVRVDESKLPVLQLKDAHVSFRATGKRAKACAEIKYSGCIDCGSADDLTESQAQQQELGERRRQIIYGAIDVCRVEIARNRIRSKILVQALLHNLEREAPGTMAHVKKHTAPASLEHLGQQLSPVVEHTVRMAIEGMGHHVAFLHQSQKLLERRMRSADVDHQGQACFVGGLACPLHAFVIVRAGVLLRKADFETNDQVSILAGGLDS